MPSLSRLSLLLPRRCRRTQGKHANLQRTLRIFLSSLPLASPLRPRRSLALITPLLLAAGGTWQQLLTGFQARGVAVRSEHPRCNEPGLEGLYVRGQRAVIVCRRGDPSITLRHEGWHLVQTLCLAGRPWLAPESVARQLGRRDRRELEVLVPRSQWLREAEARVMARLAPDAYFLQLDRACGERLSPPPASPDPPASSR
jgi:hypothetical protein